MKLPCSLEYPEVYFNLNYGQRVPLQAVRNMDDLETMACPPKYRSLATFHKYYSGEAQV